MYVLLQPITGTFFLAPISIAFAHIFVGVNIQKQLVNMRWGLRRFREHICKPLKIPHVCYPPRSHLHRPQQRTISLCCDEQQARLQILCNWKLGSLGLPRNLFPWQLPNKTQPKNPSSYWSRRNSNPSSRRRRNHPSWTWNTIPYQILHLGVPEISLPQRKEETNKQGDPHGATLPTTQSRGIMLQEAWWHLKFLASTPPSTTSVFQPAPRLKGFTYRAAYKLLAFHPKIGLTSQPTKCSPCQLWIWQFWNSGGSVSIT